MLPQDITAYVRNLVLTQDIIDEEVHAQFGSRVGRVLLSEVPIVENLENKILNRIELKPETFDMTSWHAQKKRVRSPYGGLEIVKKLFEASNFRSSAEKAIEAAHECGTTHCRAGWAIHVAGLAGWKLEERIGAKMAGRFIYIKSTGRLPSFGGSDEEALRDIKREAAREFSKADRAFAKKREP